MPYPEFPGEELAVKTLYKNISIQLINKRQRKPKEQSKTDNPETLPILGTQDTGRRQTKQKNKTNKNTKTTHETTEDYNSDTGGTGQARYRTIKRQRTPQKHSRMGNPETLATLGTLCHKTKTNKT